MVSEVLENLSPDLNGAAENGEISNDIDNAMAASTAEDNVSAETPADRPVSPQITVTDTTDETKEVADETGSNGEMGDKKEIVGDNKENMGDNKEADDNEVAPTEPTVSEVAVLEEPDLAASNSASNSDETMKQADEIKTEELTTDVPLAEEETLGSKTIDSTTEPSPMSEVVEATATDSAQDKENEQPVVVANKIQPQPSEESGAMFEDVSSDTVTTSTEKTEDSLEIASKPPKTEEKPATATPAKQAPAVEALKEKGTPKKEKSKSRQGTPAKEEGGQKSAKQLEAEAAKAKLAEKRREAREKAQREAEEKARREEEER